MISLRFALFFTLLALSASGWAQASLPLFCKDTLLAGLENPMESRGSQDDVILPQNLSSGKLLELSEKINFYRRLNNTPVRATIIARDRQMARLNHYLSVGGGKVRDAVALLQDTFFQTEQAVRVIQSNVARDTQYEKYEETLGEYYSDYIYFRQYLERVIAPGSKTRAGTEFSVDYVLAAKSLYKQLGLVDAKQYGVSYQQTNINLVRPAIEEIENSFSQSENAITAKLKQDLWAERYSALRSLFSALMLQDTVQAVAGKAYDAAISRVPYLRGPFRFIVRSFRDSIARKIDLYNIKSVVFAKADAAKKLSLLRSLASNSQSSFLVSFARFVDDDIRNTWLELESIAGAQAKSGKDPLMKDFYKKMQDADRLASDYGTLSEYYPPSPMIQIAGWIVTGTTASTALYHQFAPHDWPFWQAVDAIFHVLNLH